MSKRGRKNIVAPRPARPVSVPQAPLIHGEPNNITVAMQSPPPVTVGARYRVCGFWRRLAAGFVDGLVLLPLVLLFGGATSVMSGQSMPRVGELGFGYVVHLAVDGGIPGAVALGMTAIVVLLYEIIFLSTSGQTPGMRATGMRLIDGYGEPPSVMRVVVRIGGMIASFAAFALGMLWIGFSREKRGVHDLIAGTYVVRGAPGAVTARHVSPASAVTQ